MDGEFFALGVFIAPQEDGTYRVECNSPHSDTSEYSSNLCSPIRRHHLSQYRRKNGLSSHSESSQPPPHEIAAIEPEDEFHEHTLSIDTQSPLTTFLLWPKPPNQPLSSPGATMTTKGTQALRSQLSCVAVRAAERMAPRNSSNTTSLPQLPCCFSPTTKRRMMTLVSCSVPR